ncbi:UNVERIFIED_CONTAM: hypothetical protein Slati_1076700 [Sesamum latifolium]|uniref:Uncharacterized protein n=1 Tax=Sesamum latifolium TaxID=2727402 RepID=A0AAW2XTR4_9LAMI
MLNSLWFRTNFSSTSVVSPFHGGSLQLKLFSSAARPIWSFAEADSFSANYLMKIWGLSREKAFSAAKHLNIESTEKPDSVIAFLKNHGFTTEQIGSMVRSGQGFLEKHIVPSYNYINSLFKSNGVNFVSMKKLAMILYCDLQRHLLPNVEVLREAGVLDKKIIFLVVHQPRVFMVDEKRFRKTVEEVEKMGFSPSMLRFVLALEVRCLMSKSMWEKKVAIYNKWGWSDGEIILAFEKLPQCMLVSVDKLLAVMDFFVNNMGFDHSLVSKRPQLIKFSLEKRIRPRCSVYKILVENGLIKKRSNLTPVVESTEKDFLKKFVMCYEKEVPGLLQLYQERVGNVKVYDK